MRKLAVSMIQAYRKLLPFRQFFMRTFIGQGAYECMFHPTCSEYTEKAIEKHGFMKGLFLGLKRIVRCRPGSKGGFDPVP